VCRLPEQCLQKYKMDLVSSVLWINNYTEL
jgi:hypothetical protein